MIKKTMRRAIFLCLFLAVFTGAVFSQNIKEADLAGIWYSDNPELLAKKVKSFLEEADAAPIEEEVTAIISPHAGLVYSGPAAAYAFKAVKNKEINTVVVVGFSHKKSYEGIAVFDKDGYRTPLGVLYADKGLREAVISADEKIFAMPEAFDGENSIELILPFIQTAFKNPKILLSAIGRQSFENCEILGEALYGALKGKDNFLIIASTDMSHYLPYSKTKDIDALSADLITEMRPKELFLESAGKNRMCGLGAVVSTMIAAKKLGANKVKILKTSASSTNPDEKAVGYLSAAFIKVKEDKDEARKETEDMDGFLNDRREKELLGLARSTLNLYVTKREILEPETDDPRLKEIMGVFVTLNKSGQLRGCIGNIIGRKPLHIGVRDMAISSAAQDPRFSPVIESELKDIKIEISVLSPPKKINSPDEIIIGKHGVMVKKGFNSGVYLPQVAHETGWGKEEFMNSLCAHKAGIPANSWKTGECEIYIFTAEVFGE